MNITRVKIRHAQRLRDVWHKAARQRDDLGYQWSQTHRYWQELSALKRRSELAEAHGLNQAFLSVQEDFRWKIDELTRHLQLLRDEAYTPVKEPTLADWMKELDALDEEFGNFKFDQKQSVISIRTEFITLQDVELGPFAIELHWQRLAHQKGSCCFTIVALEPNPASNRDEIRHPHVNDDDLCAGDAQKPIEKALAEGRITEAFLLIRSVLTTYNPKSAYVQLDQWDGFSCSDCGGRMSREDSSYCETCHSDLCEGCASFCRSCEETRCSGCLNSCVGCSDLCCSRCLETATDCDSLCSSCRGICSTCDSVLLQSDLDESGRCPACAAPEEPQPTTQLEEVHAS